ncbi:MAG: hypothetical protein IKJ37_06210, partial [Kiritimatiellae bacterium]|nr:hypothetical protein [Kiritimatiellia bacterium]
MRGARVLFAVVLFCASIVRASTIELAWTMPDGCVKREVRKLKETDGVAIFALKKEEIAARKALSLALTPDFARARKGDDGFWVFSSGEYGTFRCDEGVAK